MRRFVRLAMGLVVAAAIAAHLYFWYWPRERPAVFRPESPTARLVLDGDQDVRLWLPFPHQNLARVARWFEGGGDVVAVAARVAGLGEVDVPSLGPFDVPPCRSLALAVDEDGQRLALVIEMYPSMALLSRLAGWVAGNPLLAGGPVVLGERRYETSWSGRTWSLTSSTRRRGRGASPTVEANQRALGLLVLGEGRDPFPAGVYVAQREGTALVLRSVGDAARGFGELAPFDRELAFAGVRRHGAEASVLLMPSTRHSSAVSLPDAAILFRGAEPRWSLPGHRIARLLALEPVTASADGWQILAREESILPLARSVAAQLDRSPTPLPRYAVSIRPGLYRPLVATIAAITDKVPLVPRDEARYWQDVNDLLAITPPDSRLEVQIEADGFVEVRVSVFDTAAAPP